MSPIEFAKILWNYGSFPESKLRRIFDPDRGAKIFKTGAYE